MRPARTLSRYVLRETLQYTALGLAAITLVLVTRNLLRFLDDLIAVGFSMPELLAVLRCLVVMLAVYALPVAFLFGVLLAVGRLASDHETTALRACGLGPAALLVPLVALGFAVSCLTWGLALEVEHRARRELRGVLRAMAAQGSLLEAGRFHEIAGRVFFVERREADERLGGILISDRSDPARPFTIFAERGRLALDAHRGEVRVELEEGDIHVEPGAGDGGYQRISFASFDYAFDLGRLLSEAPEELRPKQMTTEELLDVRTHVRRGGSLERYRRSDLAAYEVQLHRRVALPAAPMLFAWVGVPLAMRERRGARSLGVLFCSLMAFSYYAIFSVSEMIALRNIAPAALALWLPNACFVVIGAVLIRRLRRPPAR